MQAYIKPSSVVLHVPDGTIHSFGVASNTDAATVQSFGEEWSRHSTFDAEELRIAGDQYFDIVDASMLGSTCDALDIGCGSGRWSLYLSPRVRHIEAIDPSEAVLVAHQMTRNCGNVRVTQAGYGNIPFAPASFDFVFSLGVVHHVPDTAGAIREAANMVKPGGWLLLYIYYALDNRGAAFRMLFTLTNFLRAGVSRLPRIIKFMACDLLAVFVYGPLVMLARLLRFVFPGRQFWRRIPLSYYVDKTWRIIRNDALDRFGTPLEQRFSREEIGQMLRDAGMDEIRFSENAPFWHVVAHRHAAVR